MSLAACTDHALSYGPSFEASPNNPDDLAVFPGLVERARFEHTTFSAHLGDLETSGEMIYVANSYDGLAAYHLWPNGGLVLTLDKPADPPPRCTTLAVHAPSHTLFCGSDSTDTIAAYDLEDPETPKQRDLAAAPGPGLFVRDLFVHGDALLLARFDEGLHVAQIDAKGALSPLKKASLAGNVRFVSGSDTTLAALTSDRGLVRLNPKDPLAPELETLALDGPPVGLSVRDSRAAVALGSRGAAVVSLEGPMRVVAEVHPSGVVTAVDLDGDKLAAATLDGVFLYDLSADPPRLSGYARAGAVETDVAFLDGDLLVSDFFFLDRYLVRPGGDVTMLDVPRGTYVRPGDPARLPVQNHGELPLVLEARSGSRALAASRTVLPGQTDVLELSPSLVAELVDPQSQETILRLRTLYPALRDEDPPVFRATERDSTFTLLVRREDADPALVGRPAVGDPFPEVWISSGGTLRALPLPDERTRVVFYSTNCIAMWSELEDAAFCARRGELDGGATPVFVSIEDAEGMGFPKRFGLSDMLFGRDGSDDVKPLNAHFGDVLYDGGFWLGRIIAGAQHPTDYLVDRKGVVEAVEREYRGRYPLR